MDEKLTKEILKKMDNIVKLLALTAGAGLTLTERIILLDKAGFRPIEIAEILGTTSNAINVILFHNRKKGASKHGKNKNRNKSA